MKRALAIAVALVGLLGPASAGASFDAPARTGEAWSMAMQRFGVPCAGVVDIRWGHLGILTNAHSDWVGDPADPAGYIKCVVTFSYDVDWDWPKLCTVAEHEDGHLTGHSHVDDPHDVMSPTYIFPTMECAGHAEPPAQPAAATRPSPAPVAASSAHHRRCFTWRAWSYHRHVCVRAR